jgi:DNA primase
LSVGVAATIKEKLDVVELIGETVQLRKAGTTFKGLCPFHGEKTASFTVTPARETWKCFGCGRGGDIFNFVMERDGVDFPTALRSLAGRAGVEMSERTSREDAQRRRLRDALEAAISFYHQVLTSHAAGAPARDYLHGRGFSDETISTFGLGWAPDAWDALGSALTRRRGIAEPDLEGAGLVGRRRGGGVYDRFRGRVIFPIRDASGGATGMTGRILGAPSEASGPKYLNTPQTLLFDKGRTLYLIDRAKSAIRKSGVAVLVEGNTDALMAHQAGFANVVCSMGTALTPGQIELLTRYAPRIALAYDVDAAGQSAATFGATELTALVGEIERSPYRGRLTDVDVVRLPDGRDPDEVIRDEPDAWRAATETPQPIMEFLIDRAAARHDQRTVPGRERLVAAVLPTLRSISDPVRRDGYVQLLARRSGVEERTLLESLRRPEPSGRAAGTRGATPAGSRINLEAVMAQPGALDPRAVERAIEPAEAALLRLVLIEPGRYEATAARMDNDPFVTTPARELWKALGAALGAHGAALGSHGAALGSHGAAVGSLGAAQEAHGGDGFDRAAFISGLDATLSGIAQTLLARTDPLPASDWETQQAIEQSLLTLERARLSEQIEYTRARIAEAEAAHDGEEVEGLQHEVLELQQRRLQLDRAVADTSLLARRRIHPKPVTDQVEVAHGN